MKYVILAVLLASILLLTGCNVNDGIGNIFNAIWGSKFTPWVILGVIVFYIISKRNSGGKS